MDRLIRRGRADRRKRGIFSSREVLLKSNLNPNDAVVAHMDVDVLFKTMNGVAMSEALVVRDTGSPVSIVKRSFVPEGSPIRPYSGRALYWGQSGRMRATGCVEGRIAWTDNTAVPVRLIIVDDTELPGHVDALLGNDVLWLAACHISHDETGPPTVSFPGDPIHTRMYVTERQLRERMMQRGDKGRHFTRGNIQVVCTEGCVLEKRPPPSRSGTFNVTAVDTTPIPPFAKRMIVARVEVRHYSVPTSDVDVAFQAAEPIGIGGVELPSVVFTMAAGNDKPWVYLLARNNSRITRYLTAGERIGTATTEFAAMDMVGKKQRGTTTCCTDCTRDPHFACKCEQVDEIVSDPFTTSFVGAVSPADFHYLGSFARDTGERSKTQFETLHITPGGNDVRISDALAADDIRISDAFAADSATDEMCLECENVEEEIAKVAMHWLDESRKASRWRRSRKCQRQDVARGRRRGTNEAGL